MIKYVLTEYGIQDRETGSIIPEDESNTDFAEYTKWLGEGNVPIELQPSPDHELVEDEWVFKVKKANLRILFEKRAELRDKALELFEFTFTLFQVLKDKGLITNEDFEPELREKAIVWKNLLDEIESRELTEGL